MQVMNLEASIYADLTFLINFIMDFIIFWAAAKLAGIVINWRRIFFGSFLGACYAVLYLYYEYVILFSLPGKFVFSVFLVLIVFPPPDWQYFKRIFFYFYVLSFTIAGASLAANYLLQSSIASSSIPYVALLGGAACAVLIVHYAEQYVAGNILPSLLHYEVELYFGQQVCRGKGFLDTGNGLRDPLSKRPVVVAEYETLKKCLPSDFQAAFEQCENEQELLDMLGKSCWAHRLRLIPFTSIGKRNGLLIGVRRDAVRLRSSKHSMVFKNIVVGIYREKLSSGAYQMLIPADVLTKV